MTPSLCLEEDAVRESETVLQRVYMSTISWRCAGIFIAAKARCGSYLQVVLRVPVGVEDDAGVCRSQVDAESSGSCAQQEDKAVRVRSGEAVDGCLTQVTANSAIDAFVGISGQSGRTVSVCRQHHDSQHEQELFSFMYQ